MLGNGFTVPKITKPDLTDNLSKGVFDALEGIVFLNDSQIFAVKESYKLYSEKPGIRISFNLYDDVNELVDASIGFIEKLADKVQEELFSFADNQAVN